MASFLRRGDSWRVQIRKAGQSHSATFPLKAQAQQWAAQIEAEIIAGRLGKAPDKSFADMVERYLKDVTPTKRGARQEAFRLKRAMDDELGKVRLEALGPEHVADWRDRRLKSVGAASVNREWNTLSNVCQTAIKEWRWLKASPFTTVKRPPEPPPRTRVMTDDELARLLVVCGDNYSTVKGRIGLALQFALETAMRAGEICGLEAIHIHDHHVHLPLTKNGSSRDVPLSNAAKEILKLLDGYAFETGKVFGLTAPRLDAMFRKIRTSAGIEGLHFHDARATALTRLSKVLNVMQLARVSGHRDLRILQQVYYRETAADIAALMG